VKEFKLKKMWKSPNGTIRNILGGVDLPRADHLQERAAPGAGLDPADRRRPSRLRRPVSRHRFPFPGKGKLTIKFVGEDGNGDREGSVQFAPGSGVAMAMYNLDESIRDFARASSTTACCATTRSISRPRTRSSRPMTAASRTSSRRVFDAEFKAKFKRKLTYEHRLIDDMVASR
jgi:isocitrate dehydrogenase